MDLAKETKFIMNKYNIAAKKSYGQNFLIDEDVCRSIVDSAAITKNDFVIEIGPGLGTLTKYLLEKAGKVTSVELDESMIIILNDRFKLYENFELINDDILKINLEKLIKDNSNFSSVKVVANLPYYITTPIIMKLLENRLNIDSITVMVQKEVALRLTETPGGDETGAITYSISYYTEPEIVLDVPKESFMPVPKVDSAVIKLTLLNEPPVKLDDEKFFFKVIKCAFLQKRKTLVNSLSNNKVAPKETIESVLNDLNIDLRIRAEKLSLEDFANISNLLYKKTK